MEFLVKKARNCCKESTLNTCYVPPDFMLHSSPLHFVPFRWQFICMYSSGKLFSSNELNVKKWRKGFRLSIHFIYFVEWLQSIVTCFFVRGRKTFINVPFSFNSAGGLIHLNCCVKEKNKARKKHFLNRNPRSCAGLFSFMFLISSDDTIFFLLESAVFTSGQFNLFCINNLFFWKSSLPKFTLCMAMKWICRKRLMWIAVNKNRGREKIRKIFFDVSS